MPERHAISIKGGHAVIAPPAASLRAYAIGHYSFTLREVTWRVCGKTSRITNARKDAGTGHGIADGGVSILVDGYAGHKAPQAIVAVAPILLLSCGGWEVAARNIKLIPAYNSWTVGKIKHCGLIGPQ